MTRLMFAVQWLLAASLLTSAATARAQAAPTSCAKDVDCPGQLVCERGQCVAPGPAAPPAPAAPAAPAPGGAPAPAPASEPTAAPAVPEKHWFADHRGAYFLNQFEVSARGELLLGDRIGGGALALRGLFGGRTGGPAAGAGQFFGARYGLGFELAPGLISPPGTNNVNASALISVPLQLGGELGLGKSDANGWSGTVIGLDYLPQLQCVTTGSDRLGGCNLNPVALDITVDPGLSLLSSGESPGHLRFIASLVAPVGGPMLELGLGAGLAWY